MTSKRGGKVASGTLLPGPSTTVRKKAPGDEPKSAATKNLQVGGSFPTRTSKASSSAAQAVNPGGVQKRAGKQDRGKIGQKDSVRAVVAIPPNEVFLLDGEGSAVLYLPRAFENPDELLRKLQQQMPWAQGSVKLFGKEIPEPRLTCYFGDHSYKYSGRLLHARLFPPILEELRKTVLERMEGERSCSSSGAQRTSSGCSGSISTMGGKSSVLISSAAQNSIKVDVNVKQSPGGQPAAAPLVPETASFNSVLLNRYRSGADSQGWHSDDEAVYGKNPTIASVSFGAPREFQFRKIADHGKKAAVTLESGSLLLMYGPIQHLWQHSLPKRAKVAEERINLTFRQIVKPL
ncbi:unnamed protein product [Amoebophrya sp. A120]|nr:unnamed protein product [Amoebophrya sp. A120]|eukprot:GSA120T00020818001.1